MQNRYLEISQVSIDFPTDGEPYRALQNVTMSIQQGEFISLIGHSGCGKSTVLNIIAGLHQATEGGIILEGREVNEPGPDRAVVFQNHALLPWLTVYKNVELAVKSVRAAIMRDSASGDNIDVLVMNKDGAKETTEKIS